MANETRRPFFVVNPCSANGATRERFARMLPSLRSAFPSMGFSLTERPLHAGELAAQAVRDGFSPVVACGGDGTLNEAAGGILDAGLGSEAVLGYLPSGTGGDFRRILDLPAEPADAVPYIASGCERIVDAGRLQFVSADGRTVSRPFVNIASFGISGLVDHYVNTSTKALGGKASFLIGTIRGMLSYDDVRMKVIVDGQVFHEGPCKLVTAANGQFFGGGMQIAPRSALDDGLLDVTILGELSLLEFAGLSRYIYAGTHLDRPKIRSTRGRRIEVTAEGRALIDLDGEQVGRLPVVAEALPGALRLLVRG
jgi:YegS/Rv2252/BmrU family lipid kinase